jgi:hypothetical protein
MSIDVESFMLSDGVDPREHCTTPRFVGSLAFQVASFRSRNCQVGYDPLPENPYHGNVWDTAGKHKFSRSIQRALLKEATWLVPLPNVAIVDD